MVGCSSLGVGWDVWGVRLRDLDGSCGTRQGDVGSVKLGQLSGDS